LKTTVPLGRLRLGTALTVAVNVTGRPAALGLLELVKVVVVGAATTVWVRLAELAENESVLVKNA
jgi:hypothetical protein